MTELPRFLKFLLNQMPLAERVLLGLWASLAVGCGAVFASALPYIYAQEDSIRCGSLGLTRVAVALVPGSIGAIVVMAVLFHVGRGLVAAYRWKWAVGLPLMGIILWISAALASTVVYVSFLNEVAILIADPPSLPNDLRNVKACNEFIQNAKRHNPLQDWLIQHSSQHDHALEK